ncbi:anaerobic ribonucleoside-triphosphate reductase activating protein [Methanobrevibacter filiformis]|nr:anaerobic ribonucleoside-triphosphate reductase activating protein [Methanobrevibacter filiformis]
MKIGGTLISSIEFSGYMSLVIFLAGCPLRCLYCHNHELIKGGEEATLEGAFKLIDDSKDFIDGIVISGGEPLVQVEDLKSILAYAKSLKLKTKLDTSGYDPERLKKVIDLVDYVSLDIKAPYAKYKEITRLNIGDNVKKSIEIVNNAKNTYLECRTTFVPTLITVEDIKEIASKLKCDKYTIQQFRNKNVLDRSLEHVESPNPADLKEIAKEIKTNFKEVSVKTAEFGEEKI